MRAARPRSAAIITWRRRPRMEHEHARERDRERGDLVAEERDGLAGPEASEVAVAAQERRRTPQNTSEACRSGCRRELAQTSSPSSGNPSARNIMSRDPPGLSNGFEIRST